MRVTMISLAACVAMAGNAQQSQSPGGGFQKPVAPPPANATRPPAQPQPGQTPPVVQEPLPPVLGGSNQAQFRLGASNTFALTNRFGVDTNRFALTNRLGNLTNRPLGSITNTANSSSNQAGVTVSNRVVGTNSVTLTNSSGITIADQAVTAADRTLVVDLRQAVLPRLQAPGPWAPVAFRVREGVVTLVGTVQTVELRRQLELVATQTPGVVRVVNQLVVESGGRTFSKPDWDLLVQVREAVLPEIQVNGAPAPVEFDVQQGVVTLKGIVPSVDDGDRIVSLVRQVPGVEQVVSQLTVGVQTGAATSSLTDSVSAGINLTTNRASTNLSPTGRTNSFTLPQPTNTSSRRGP